MTDRTDYRQVKSALEKNESLLNEAQKIAHLGHYSLDLKTGRWTNSDELDRIFGIDKSYQRDVDGWLKLVHPDFVETMSHYFQDYVVDQRRSFDKEYKIIKANTGEERWVHGLGCLKVDENNPPTEMFGTIQDITERRQNQLQLNLQASALEASANSIVITDAKGNMQWTNAAFSQLTGYSAEEVVGQNPRILKSGEQDSAFYHDLWATILSGKTWRGELINKRKDGRTYIEDQVITPLLDTAGKVTHFIGIKQDVTVKRERQEKLKRSEHRYRQLIEFLPDSVLVHDGKKVLFVNQMAVRLLKAKNADELVGRAVQDLLDPEDWPAVRDRIEKLLAGTADAPFMEQRLVRMDGTTLEVEVEATALVWEGQRAVLVLARDIRERKRLQSELVQTAVETTALLAKTVDEKDEYTHGHCERLSKLAIVVGRAMGLDGEELQQLDHAALLHDLGKIGVPDAVLNKPAKLNDEEWAKMREHPSIGAKLIEKIHTFGSVSTIVYQHHERWDGQGYPQGIKGKDIVVEARILSVVDAYDAITTNRPYREAASQEVAFRELRKGSGTQFDPDVVNALLATFQSNDTVVQDN